MYQQGNITLTLYFLSRGYSRIAYVRDAYVYSYYLNLSVYVYMWMFVCMRMMHARVCAM